MTNEEKLEILKDWLNEHGYRFRSNCKSKTLGVWMDIKITRPMIAIKATTSKDEEQEFFKSVITRYYPFFVRESESMDFVLEKIQNCVVQSQKETERRIAKRRAKREYLAMIRANQEAKRLAKEASIKKHKRKRIVHYEKVDYRYMCGD